MGMIETMKEVAELIQKADNIDLMRKLVAVQTQVVELFEENRTLKERLVIREELTFRANSYWRDGEGPFCSQCWDTGGRLVRVHVTKGSYPRCPACKTSIHPIEEEAGE